MVLTGVIVNVAAVLAGSMLGCLVKLPERIKETIMHGLGLAVCLIGISMGLDTGNIIIPVAALVVGGGLGALICLENRLENVGARMARLVKAKGRFTEGFLTATLVYCVGAMAVIGSLNSGLTGDHGVLFTKAILDGTTAVFFTASLGIGVAFSVIPLFIYQGGIALCAGLVAPFMSEGVLAELSATGGLLILGIGLNMLGAAKIKVGNLLPAVIAAALIAYFAA
ncbi:MAG: DUF554 domain-containing protein [Limnochordia bacterium]